MSSISSRQVKGQGLVDRILVLVSLVVIGTLMLLDPRTGKIDITISNARETLGSTAGSTVSREVVSFTSDEQYWSANCSHGWSSDSTCDLLVARARSCAVSVDSAYCSEYDAYMQQFYNRH